jgi:hypothetical protein
VRAGRTTVYSAFGVPVSVRYPRKLRARVEEILPPVRDAVAVGVTPKRYYLEDHAGALYRAFDHEAKFFIEDANLAYVLNVLDATMRLHIAEHAQGYVFVHAGAVEVDGGALVLPGASFAGKSTLVHALVRHGARYMSDEYAVLDEAGCVVPYPRPISVRVAGGLTEEVDASAVGAVADMRPVPLRLVAVTEFAPGASWDPDELSPGQGALRLFEDAPTAIARPGDALGVVRRAISGAVMLEGLRGEADEVAPLLISQLRELVAERV